MAAFRGRNSPWLKRVLIPFWVVQLLFTVMLVVVSALAASSLPGDTYSYGASTSIGHVIWPHVLFMGGVLVCLVLNIIEIVHFAQHRLHPRTYLIWQIIKVSMWSILFLIYVVRLWHNAYTKNAEYTRYQEHESLLQWHWSSGRAVFFGGDIEIIILILAYYGSLIYAWVVHRRHSRANTLRPAYIGREGVLSNRTDSIQLPEYENHSSLGDREQGVELAERGEKVRKTRTPERGLSLDGEGGSH